MRKEVGLEVEAARVLHGKYASPLGSVDGAYIFKKARGMSGALVVIVSSGIDWAADGLPPPVFEHVSVTRKDKTPTWDDMLYVRDLFFSEEEAVTMFVGKTYSADAGHCLHMWRAVGVPTPTPPAMAERILDPMRK